MRRGWRFGIDCFLEEGAYTTLASAVALLVVLTLLFSSVTAIWSAARSGEVQASADATALAGSNVVASYRTAATVVDAAVLSMGLAGLCMTGAGLVATLIPGAQAAAAETVEAGIRMLDLRNDLAASASEGLSRLEGALPYLVAANGARVCAAQGTEEIAYTGTALAAPRDSASRFPALEGEGIPTEELTATADELDEAARALSAAAEQAEDAKRAAWLADCGSEGANMQERAGRLSGLTAAENPDVASSITWEPPVALDRAGVEAAADAAARDAFYAYALQELEGARIEEADGRMVSTLELLPRNTDEVRGTALYSDARWPSTVEAEGLTLHYGSGCPGATGAAGPLLALAATESGAARECPVCRFGVGDVGKTPAASTSIDNGFEYHLRAFTQALDEYVVRRNEELALEGAAREAADASAGAFEEALGTLAGKRPRIAPPGRYGCIGVAVTGESATPEELSQAFAPGSVLAARGALSASALAPETATSSHNVLSEFFARVSEETGGGAMGLVDDVMGLWGSLLMSYGEAAGGLASAFDGMTEGLSSLGMGPVASWLNDRIDGAASALDLEPVDLSLVKPVLTDTSHVIARSGMSGLADAQELMRSLPVGATDPEALLAALGYGAVETIDELTFTLAEIPLPGGGSLPLTIRLRDLVRGGAS